MLGSIVDNDGLHIALHIPRTLTKNFLRGGKQAMRFLNNSVSSRLRKVSSALSRGDAIFEMTVLTLTATTILIVLVQGTLLFTRASVVKNLAHLGSTYAAANPGIDVPTIKNYVLQNAPGIVGADGGSSLNITVNPNITPRRLGSSVTVTVAYSYPQAKSFGASAFGLNFPSTLTSSDTGATQ
jgi:hypothetical protein